MLYTASKALNRDQTRGSQNNMFTSLGVISPAGFPWEFTGPKTAREQSHGVGALYLQAAEINEFCVLEQPLGKSVYLQGEKRQSKGDFDLTEEFIRALFNGCLYLRLFIIIWLLKNKIIFRKHFQNHPLCETLEYLYPWSKLLVVRSPTVGYFVT